MDHETEITIRKVKWSIETLTKAVGSRTVNWKDKDETNPHNNSKYKGRLVFVVLIMFKG